MSKSFVLSFLHEFFVTLQSIIYAKTTNKMWIRLLLILAILLTLVILYNKSNPPERQEGFEQNSTFVLHQNNDIYDKFYVDKYDKIMKPEDRSKFEINTIIVHNIRLMCLLCHMCYPNISIITVTHVLP